MRVVKLFATLIALLPAPAAVAGLAMANHGVTMVAVANEEDSDYVYRSVEQMPRFPGGEAALMKHIDTHICYPAGEDDDIEGSVIAQFIVEADGSVGQVKVVRSLGEPFDNEAIRVIKSLPKFRPGIQNGCKVRVWYTLPVPFRAKKY